MGPGWQNNGKLLLSDEALSDSGSRQSAAAVRVANRLAQNRVATLRTRVRARRSSGHVWEVHDLSNRGPATPRDCFDSIFEPMVQLPTGTDSTQRRKVGWLTGLEPATTGITIRDSTN